MRTSERWDVGLAFCRLLVGGGCVFDINVRRPVHTGVLGSGVARRNNRSSLLLLWPRSDGYWYLALGLATAAWSSPTRIGSLLFLFLQLQGHGKVGIMLLLLFLW
jgi:hypothetical protein